MADLRLHVNLQGGDETEVEAPPSISTADFINELAASLNLPARDANDHPVSWRLDNKDTQRTLDLRKSLEENGVRSNHRLSLMREVTAGAASERKLMRLRTEHEMLLKLNQESDHVHVTPKTRPGSPPEEYQVTFKCRGIAGIDAARRPIFADLHSARIYLGEQYPALAPRVSWETAIWHPNVKHDTKEVCINSWEWLGGMTVYDLCRQLFEMVQYQNYQAGSTQPYPYDREVASWVLDYGEPHGIVDKARGIAVDNKPFLRPIATAAGTNPPLVRVVSRPATPKVQIIRRS